MIYENTPVIQTERLILRRFTAHDTEALFAILSDEEANQFLPWFPVKNLDEAETFLHDRFLAEYEKPSAYRYAVCRKEDDQPFGYVWLSDHESHDFGYGFRKVFWHQGFAAESAKAVMKRIQTAGYPYITATHDKNNPRSGEVMKTLGMSYQYSYIEQWQPKNFPVTFRMYQLNLDGNHNRVYSAYWDQSESHFIENAI